MKIVMVDDSAAERKLCRILLEEAHGAQLQFFEADTAAAGLEMIAAEKPDCVLLDYRLPDMTGLELLAQLGSSYPRMPSAVVMLTGVTSEQIAVDAMKAGAQDYLVKDRITSGSLGIAIQNAMHKVHLMHALEAERDRLAQALEEKEVLLQEVHHRVKNNLQVVASLLRLQADEGQTAADALRESQLRVETMAMIHEQLYQSGDLRRVNLAEHAALLTNNLLNAYGAYERVVGRVAVEPLVLGVDQAIPDGRAVLTVRDNGAGLPEGFDPKRGTSLGLRIVQILTRQLKGTFEIERAGGTRFRVGFPVLPDRAGGNDATF
jgi:two-component sensor histidine kinase